MRTSVDKFQIRNRELTGADFNSSIGIYDETQNYPVGSFVFWNATKYRCKIEVFGIAEGDLSHAPNINTENWEEVTFSGISAEEHKLLDQLIHNIAEDSFCEIIRTSNKVSSIIIWTNDVKTIKIREFIITRDVNNKVSSIVIKQYNSSGTLVETYTQTITRTSNIVTSITGVLT